MILEIFIKSFVGLIFLLTMKMGLKRRKVENHCSKVRSYCHLTNLRCDLPFIRFFSVKLTRNLSTTTEWNEKETGSKKSLQERTMTTGCDAG